MFVKSIESAVAVAQSFGKERYVPVLDYRRHARLLGFDRLAPVFQTSNVTGEGLDYVCLEFHLR